ncbi:MAG TPA: hypothetical protein VK779_01720 [Rhizomicrobium sp.]|jgi:hypothetical protein|nr:hypothetical protein [Rhizomicrobium sp.]
MSSWISVTTPSARAALRFEHDLRLALSAEPGFQIIPFRYDPNLGPEQNAKTFISFLSHIRNAQGLIAYEVEVLRFFSLTPAHLCHVFAPAEISGTHSALSPAALADIVDNLLALKSLNRHVEVCAPQTRSWSSLADAIFGGKIADVPLAFLAPGAPARDEGLSLGIAADLSPAGWEMLAAFLNELAAVENAGPMRVHASVELFQTPYISSLRDIPGVTLIEGMAPDHRADAGGDFLIDTAADLHRLDMSARAAAIAGATLLILDSDEALRKLKIVDATGTTIPLEKFATDAEFRLGLRKAAAERAIQIAAEANAFWRNLLIGGWDSHTARNRPAFVDARVYESLIAVQEHDRETAASRAYMCKLASAQAALDLADAAARTDAASIWSIIALANRLARVTASTPSRPSTLSSDHLFVFPNDYGMHQRAVLQGWFASLPVVLRSPKADGERIPSFNDANDDVIAYSVGLLEEAEGGRQISADGALLFLKTDDLPEAEELAIVMRFALAGDQPACALTIDIAGKPTRTIALTRGMPRHVQFRVKMPDDSETGLQIKLTPAEALRARILLTDVGIEPAGEQDDIHIEPLDPIGFKTREILPLETIAISGAFALEHDPDGAPFRWVSRELILELPEESEEDEASAEGDVPSTPWVVLKFNPHPAARSELLAADLHWHAKGAAPAALTLRRLGALDNGIVFGAPIGVAKNGGLARINFRSRNYPLSQADGRLAAAHWTGAWIASPSRTQRVGATQRLIPLDVANSRLFSDGWYLLESVRGLPSRWMARESLLSGTHIPEPGTRLFLALAGPVLRGNPTLVPTIARLDGQPMKLCAQNETAESWMLLFESTVPADAFGFSQIELIAESARVLGPNDPREASLLVNFAALIDPAGPAAENALSEIAIPNCTLIHEHWGGGLSGAWLPSTVSILCVCPAGMDELLIEGAAATDVPSIEGLAVEIGAARLDPKITIAKDGSWTLRAALPKDAQGSALLLQLNVPGNGRVMLRHLGFERSAAA